LRGVLEKWAVKCQKCYMVQTVGGPTDCCEDCDVPSGALEGERHDKAASTDQVWGLW